MRHPKSSLLTIIALASCLSSAGCSTQSMYEVVAGVGSMDCGGLPSPEERARCKKANDLSYDKYEIERRKAKGN